MAQMTKQQGRSHFYYGVMTWRCWTPFHSEPDGACGARERLGAHAPRRLDDGACREQRAVARARAEVDGIHALGHDRQLVLRLGRERCHVLDMLGGVHALQLRLGRGSRGHAAAPVREALVC